MSVNLTREADLAEEWKLTLKQFRHLRRLHGWAHVHFSRQDIRYTDAQIEQIVRDMTASGATRREPVAASTGQTSRSAARSA